MSARLPVFGGLWTLVDEDVAERFSNVRLSLTAGKGKNRYVAFSGRDSSGKTVRVRLHRRILQVDGLKGFVIDHINGNFLDNRRCNLRLCTQRQNVWNTGLRKNNKTGFLGVRLQNGKYRAQIQHFGMYFYLGRFETPEEAACAYDRKALELRGADAVLNFMPGVRGKAAAKSPGKPSQLALFEKPVP